MGAKDRILEAGTSVNVLQKAETPEFLADCVKKAHFEPELESDIVDACSINDYTALLLAGGDLSISEAADKLFLMEDEAKLLLEICKQECLRIGVNFGDGSVYECKTINHGEKMVSDDAATVKSNPPTSSRNTIKEAPVNGDSKVSSSANQLKASSLPIPAVSGIKQISKPAALAISSPSKPIDNIPTTPSFFAFPSSVASKPVSSTKTSPTVFQDKLSTFELPLAPSLPFSSSTSARNPRTDNIVTPEQPPADSHKSKLNNSSSKTTNTPSPSNEVVKPLVDKQTPRSMPVKSVRSLGVSNLKEVQSVPPKPVAVKAVEETPRTLLRGNSSKPSTKFTPSPSMKLETVPSYMRATAAFKNRHKPEDSTSPSNDMAILQPPFSKSVALDRPISLKKSNSITLTQASTERTVKQPVFDNIRSSLLRPTKAFLAWVKNKEEVEVPKEEAPAFKARPVPKAVRQQAARAAEEKKIKEKTPEGALPSPGPPTAAKWVRA